MPIALALLSSFALYLPLTPAMEPAVEPPPVLVGDQRIEWADLQPQLAEAVGNQVIEDLALTMALKAEIDRLHVSLPANSAESEKTVLMSSLAAAANLPESEGAALLERVRTNRGLGPARFQALLERNAMLRAIVRAEAGSEPAVTDEDLRHAYELKYGPRVRIRLILVKTQQLAQEAATRLAKEPFAEVAAKLSIDPSNARGGLLDPFSPEDPNYPVAVRKVISGLEPGKSSPPIAVTFGSNQGFALIKLEERIPAPASAPSREAAAESLKTEIRIVRERAAMDRVAKRLLAESKVTVFDRSLGWSWEQRQPPNVTPR